MTDSSKTRRKSSTPSPNRFSYPLFLDLTGKRCLVVGGGKVAERKCSTLLKAGAEVTVVSPELTRRIERYKESGAVRHVPRGYRKSDVRSAFLVIAATDSEKTNRRVSRDAAAAGKLVNVVDSPSLCNFIVPSVVKRGLLTIAISIAGASPAAAKAIRKDLEKRYGPEFAGRLDEMKRMRSKAMREIGDKKKRERFLKGLVRDLLRSPEPGGS